MFIALKISGRTFSLLIFLAKKFDNFLEICGVVGLNWEFLERSRRCWYLKYQPKYLSGCVLCKEEYSAVTAC